MGGPGIEKEDKDGGAIANVAVKHWAVKLPRAVREDTMRRDCD